MYKEKIPPELLQEPELTIRILDYELGNINKIMVHMEAFGPCGYLGDLRNELGDAHTMLCLLSEQLGHPDLEALREEGMERFIDRLAERKEAQEKRLVDHIHCLGVCVQSFWVWGYLWNQEEI